MTRITMRLVASGQFTAAQIAEQVGISRRQFFHNTPRQVVWKAYWNVSTAAASGFKYKAGCWNNCRPVCGRVGENGPRRFNTGCGNSTKPNLK